MSTDTIFICNPADLQIVRDLVNNDLLYRNTVKLVTDYYIPRHHIFHLTKDKLVEITDVFK